ncbi:hypothetical protein [Vibrio sp. ER1A]|uniref:hypothetical protein n=1 Tax=Vibrio sp. ER1A TaxID=1517681 RepID=UPI0004DCE6A9|nr:hypothetical protein [Vibrio sp. ER1A]KFA99436.1 hypothetical protein HW45_03475 [Vibrio sp. ER1A]
MTTIAYSHKEKVVAIDSRVTIGDCIINDDENKIYATEHGVFFLAGNTSDCRYVAENFSSPPRKNAHVYGIIWRNDKNHWLSLDDGDVILTELNCDITAGSGEAYAQAALDFGKTAKEAVEYAMTRDCKTGGEVRVYSIGAEGHSCKK